MCVHSLTHQPTHPVIETKAQCAVILSAHRSSAGVHCLVIVSGSLTLSLLSVQVNRKLVKQTVMTSVYGVTYIGARQQISQRLKERGLDQTSQENYLGACYAAKVTSSTLSHPARHL